MTKDEAERAVRRAIGEWKNVTGAKSAPGKPADFYAFKKWADHNGYAVYLSHSDSVLEIWFDQAMQQMEWR